MNESINYDCVCRSEPGFLGSAKYMRSLSDTNFALFFVYFIRKLDPFFINLVRKGVSIKKK